MKKMAVEDEIFLEELNKQPELKERFKGILKIARDEIEDCRLFDDAEERTTVELRKLGKEVLEGWAQTKHLEYNKRLKEKEPGLRLREKKRA